MVPSGKEDSPSGKGGGREALAGTPGAREIRQALLPGGADGEPWVSLTPAQVRLALLRELDAVPPAAGACLAAAADAESVHALRVRARRARALLSFGRPLLGRSGYRRCQARLRGILARFSAVRELDVLLAERDAFAAAGGLPSPPGVLGAVIAAERERAARDALRYLRSGALERAVEKTCRQVRALPCADGTLPDGRAAERLRRWKRKAVRQAGKKKARRPEAVHALRIRLKKIRYVQSCLAAACGAGEGGQPKLQELQERLGRACDLYANLRLLKGLRARYPGPALNKEAALLERFCRDRAGGAPEGG